MKTIFFLILPLMILICGCNSSILDDPSTVINFSIPERSHVKLTIENSYNTVIVVLVDEEMNTGYYKADFNSENLAEGIYFYIIEARGIDDTAYYKITRQMLLIK